MPLLDASRSLLVVIDLQGKLVHMVHQPAQVLEVSRRLLRLADLFQVPALLTEQYPKGLGPTEESVLAAFDALSAPKFRLEKTSFGCCGDPAFGAMVQEARPGLARPQFVVAGIEAHVCVMQTVLELLAAGHEVHVCWDGVSARGAQYRKVALERMAAAGATLTNHESVAFEWARDKNHAQFKALSNLMKEGQP